MPCQAALLGNWPPSGSSMKEGRVGWSILDRAGLKIYLHNGWRQANDPGKYMEEESDVAVVVLWIILNIHKVICYYPYFKIIHYPASITINAWSILSCLSNGTTSWIILKQVSDKRPCLRILQRSRINSCRFSISFCLSAYLSKYLSTHLSI